MLSTTTYLRVKRPRHVAPLPSLRVEGLLESDRLKRPRPNAVDNLALLFQTSTYVGEQVLSPEKLNPDSAVWKRVAVESTLTPQDAEAAVASSSKSNKRSLRFVDAVLEDMNSEDDPLSRSMRAKRPRLTLTLVSDKVDKTPLTSPEKKKNIILDPLSRLVEQSLQSVFSGEQDVSSHVEFVTGDSRLAHDPHRWLAYCSARGSGNVLHAAALFNNVEAASTVLAWDVAGLKEATDNVGRTPYQLSQLAQHNQVAELLRTSDGPEEDEYVYDVFRLQENDDTQMTSEEMKETQDATQTTVELRGGIGYWNEHGELILEAMCPEDLGNSESVDGDDDVDSNCEDFEGNDYPDEEEDQLWDEADSDEDDNVRYRPIFAASGQHFQVERSMHNGFSEDNEYVFESQYGMYESSRPDRLYAYDAKLDDESE